MSNSARSIVLVIGVRGVSVRLNVAAVRNHEPSKLPPTLSALANHAHTLIINRKLLRATPICVVWIVLDHGPIMVNAVLNAVVVSLFVRSRLQPPVSGLVLTVKLHMDKPNPFRVTPIHAL
jgi:hypothetical protein